MADHGMSGSLESPFGGSLSDGLQYVEGTDCWP